MLMYQTLKKWIYNNYDGNEMDNLIVISNFEITDNHLIKNFTLIDMNKYNDLDNNLFIHYDKKKIDFIKVIFVSNLSHNDKNYIKYKNIINNLHDIRFFYQLDGIKFLNINIF